MNSFVFALTAVSPIIILVAIGYFIKRIHLISEDFAKLANKLVFRLFLPAMLFLNIYNIESFSGIRYGYVIYAIAIIFALFLISLICSVFVTKKTDRRGVMTQVAFRSNYALVGIPLAVSLFGESGGAAASLLSAISIPIFNILAVISLSVFGDGEKKPSVKKIIIGIIKNPLIQSIALGLVCLAVRAIFVKSGISFRLSDVGVLFTVLKYLSNVATPMALIMLGAQFEFSAISRLKNEIIFGTVMRVFIAPVLGVGIAYAFFRNYFNGAEFATFIALFATPVAVSSVPMTQEIGGDTVLAGQYVVWTTILSAFSIFLATFLLSAAGIF